MTPTGHLQFIAIGLQLQRHLRHLYAATKAALALALCLWVMVCGTLALNESWHQHWHELAGDPPASESGCAIDLFASGGVAPGLDFLAVLVGFLGVAIATSMRAETRLAYCLASDAWRTRGPPVGH